MGKLFSNLSSWDSAKTFGGSFLKGALIGIPVTIIVLGLFSLLDMFSLLPASIQGMNNFPTLLAFNTIFSGASMAVTNTVSSLMQPEKEPVRANHTPTRQQGQVAQLAQASQIDSSRSTDIKRTLIQANEASLEGVAVTEPRRQHTIH